jgi:hypothetical protein
MANKIREPAPKGIAKARARITPEQRSLLEMLRTGKGVKPSGKSPKLIPWSRGAKQRPRRSFTTFGKGRWPIGRSTKGGQADARFAELVKQFESSLKKRRR